MLYFLIPCAYTNITGINLLKSKGKRLVVLLSGSLINLGIIGICFVLMALISSPIMGMYGAILILVNLGTIFMNTLVLLKFDGYYDGKGIYRSDGEGGYDAEGIYRSPGEGGYDSKGCYQSSGWSSNSSSGDGGSK